MLDMMAFYDDGGAFCDDLPAPAPPKRAIADEVVALARRVVLGVVVRAPRLIITREPARHAGGGEVHEVLVRGFIALRSDAEVICERPRGPSGPPPVLREARRRA